MSSSCLLAVGFGWLSSVICRPSSVFRESLGADSLDSCRIRRCKRVCGPLAPIFFQQALDMLNASSPPLFAIGRAPRTTSLVAAASAADSLKTHISSIFSSSRMGSRDDPLDRAAQRIVRVGRAGQDATSGVGARANMLHDAKTLVFLLRCSNPKRVFAIPAGTLTTTPLTQARRAAWRRSERRRQRRKRADERPSAGRRSKPARCFQSSTSNDVDDCVKRAGASRIAVSASRSQFDTAGPGRRQRASARHGFELHPPASHAAG